MNKNPIHIALWTLYQIQPMSCEHIMNMIFGTDHDLYDHLLRKLRGYCTTLTDANPHKMLPVDDFNVPGFLQLYIGMTPPHQMSVNRWLAANTQDAPACEDNGLYMQSFTENLERADDLRNSYQEDGMDINAATDAAHRKLRTELGDLKYRAFNEWLNKDTCPMG